MKESSKQKFNSRGAVLIEEAIATAILVVIFAALGVLLIQVAQERERRSAAIDEGAVPFDELDNGSGLTGGLRL